MPSNCSCLTVRGKLLGWSTSGYFTAMMLAAQLAPQMLSIALFSDSEFKWDKLVFRICGPALVPTNSNVMPIW
ncbi:hypothetical protein GGF42_000818 [Coemansia sp. RSA 2424]|nr:hypothetical protein GGF42_000818 [Coemansia sp. RSA 2424]